MGLLDKERGDVEKPPQPFVNPWLGRAIAIFLILGMVWVAYGMLADFSRGKRFIVSGIAAVALFIGF